MEEIKKKNTGVCENLFLREKTTKNKQTTILYKASSPPFTTTPLDTHIRRNPASKPKHATRPPPFRARICGRENSSKGFSKEREEEEARKGFASAVGVIFARI